MSVSKARTLLGLAATERSRLRRYLLTAAALMEVLEGQAVIVGGTAEEFYSRGEYHETDLDICAPMTPANRRALRELRFKQRGRHWYREDLPVPVEFPESRIEGDSGRILDVPIAGGRARLIGIDDLYLDRLRQATVRPGAEGVEFHSAVAIASAGYDQIDWRYVRKQIGLTDGLYGETLRSLNTKVRRRARRGRAGLKAQ